MRSLFTAIPIMIAKWRFLTHAEGGGKKQFPYILTGIVVASGN
jgi:hypothetical protein